MFVLELLVAVAAVGSILNAMMTPASLQFDVLEDVEEKEGYFLRPNTESQDQVTKNSVAASAAVPAPAHETHYHLHLVHHH